MSKIGLACKGQSHLSHILESLWIKQRKWRAKQSSEKTLQRGLGLCNDMLLGSQSASVHIHYITLHQDSLAQSSFSFLRNYPQYSYCTCTTRQDLAHIYVPNIYIYICMYIIFELRNKNLCNMHMSSTLLRSLLQRKRKFPEYFFRIKEILFF